MHLSFLSSACCTPMSVRPSVTQSHPGLSSARKARLEDAALWRRLWFSHGVLTRVTVFVPSDLSDPRRLQGPRTPQPRTPAPLNPSNV